MVARDGYTALICIGPVRNVRAKNAATALIARAPTCGRSIDRGEEGDEGSDAEALHVVLVYDSYKGRNLLTE